jgi:hypothetical protein
MMKLEKNKKNKEPTRASMTNSQFGSQGRVNLIESKLKKSNDDRSLTI